MTTKLPAPGAAAVATSADLVQPVLPQRSANAADRRELILKSATALFARYGYMGCSLREIADDIGLQKGHLYYYFPAKSDLLFEIASDIHQAYIDALKTWTAQPDPEKELLWSVCRRHVLLLLSRVEQIVVTYENMRFIAAHDRPKIKRLRDAYESGLRAVVATHLEANPDLPAVDVGLATKVLLGLLNWTYHWYEPGGRLSDEAISCQLADMAVASLATATTREVSRVGNGRPRQPKAAKPR